MSSAVVNGISIYVSDDDSDELAGRMRVKFRRKRKNPGSRLNDGCLRLTLRKLARWWPVLLLLPAISLLLFEVSEIAGIQHETEKTDLVPEEDSEPKGNHIHLDPTPRHGVRKPCLKILLPEEIQNLQFPVTAEPNFPIKRVVYKSNSGKQHIGTDATMFPESSKATRFNLFTGYQTIDEREESFKVNKTMEVHCGFYNENGGFKISDNDRSYMETCEAVVSTCAFGGGDDLYQPINMTKSSLEKVCYVAFWDEITRSVLEAEGKVVGEDRMIGKWRIVVVRELPFSDQRLNGKIPKILAHRLFPRARYSIWVDSKSQFRRDPLGVLEALLWRTNSVLAISEHGARSSLYDEAKAVVQKHKATPEEVEIQLNQYRKDGIPDEKRFNGHKALSEASVIVREHTPSTNLFMCLWFNEVVRFTSRDQLSFPYVVRRLKMPGINMFPVCTRKDLVISMGHKRKVKPLVKSTS